MATGRLLVSFLLSGTLAGRFEGPSASFWDPRDAVCGATSANLTHQGLPGSLFGVNLAAFGFLLSHHQTETKWPLCLVRHFGCRSARVGLRMAHLAPRKTHSVLQSKWLIFAICLPCALRFLMCFLISQVGILPGKQSRLKCASCGCLCRAGRCRKACAA